MRFFALLSLAAVATATPMKRAVDSGTYAALLKFYKYASSSYSSSCPKPLGNTLVGTFQDAKTDTQGFVATDATNKQIVIAFRGTSSKQDFITDFDFEPTPYSSSGVFLIPSGVLIHRGFLGAYNAVQSQVVALVRKAPSDYSIVVTGHSLGGGIASASIPSLKTSFFTRSITLYTYGQPRTGNSAYAGWINTLLGSKSFRVTHRTDSVVTFVPRSLGFEHHGVEYWQQTEPASANAFKQCSGNEDASCSASIPSTTFLNQDHLSYFNIFFINSFCNSATN